MSNLPDPNLSRGVLIGTSDFERSDRLGNLPAVRNNLTELNRILTDSSGGILTWETCDVVDSPDSPNSFMTRLRRAANQAEDLLLVYYSGHGVRHETKDILYLTVRTTDPETPAGSAIPFEWVKEVIEQSPARTRLLILDCCYSGMALGAMSAGTIDGRAIEVAGTSVITSSPSNTVSHSPPGERYTAFSAELIRLLAEGPRVPGETLTVDELFRSLRAGMANRELPLPKMMAGDTSSGLLLRNVRSAEPVHEPQVRVRPRAPMTHPGPERPAEPSRQPFALPHPSEGPRAEREPDTAPRVRSSHVVKAVASWPLWAGFIIGTSMGVGGVVGAGFGSPAPGVSSAKDLTLAIPMLLVGSLCGFLIRRQWKRFQQKSGRTPRLGDLHAGFGAKLERLETLTLGGVLGLLVVVFIVGLFSEVPPSDETGTGLSIKMAGLVFLAHLIAGCWYGLHRRYRSRDLDQ
ncbi:caspase family protein [Amycolatopsis cihanbeyliensis]|uniref:Caspase domain-containing protein n=1 Tax=Amycolatopsis cihanbeyliensis TaxID=1128664 RepID=A0A542DLG2_AMYCI|nr:caspase family protein [Amycolatopsis cihanbeyliensis]TQJ03918.1 caspase domain-containing protein [Amycolatopsis cihanbeyliensis]